MSRGMFKGALKHETSINFILDLHHFFSSIQLSLTMQREPNLTGENCRLCVMILSTPFKMHHLFSCIFKSELPINAQHFWVHEKSYINTF